MNQAIYNQLIEELNMHSNKDDAIFLQRFFKTGKGEYGEGDKFLGIRNPATRQIAKKYYKQITNEELLALLHNEWHEVRLCSLVMMNYLMASKNINKERKSEIYELYIANISQFINNWDLVDISAPHTLGSYLLDRKDKRILLKLADGNIWQKRVAIIATFAFIKHNQLDYSVLLCNKLMYEKHDLLHKAVGWTMREIGKKNKQILLDILADNAPNMPRTTLRYAIEKLSQKERRYYMNLKTK